MRRSSSRDSRSTFYQQRQWLFIGWREDGPAESPLRAFADADLASDILTARGASGGAVKLVGPHSAFVASCLSEIQTSVSRSTPEAEIVALGQ
eukprot:8696332-Alexandrium_andersonii.AAC.1